MTDSGGKKKKKERKRCPFKLKGYKTGTRGTRKDFRTKIAIRRTHVLCSTITVAKTWKPAKCPSVGEHVWKLWCVCTYTPRIVTQL